MAYCTQTDILEQLDEDTIIQLTDDDDVGVVDDAKVTRAIADADAEIDSYCGVRNEVPFSTVPTVIRMASVDMAIYNLYSRRQGAPDTRAKRRDDRIAWLKDVSKGTVSLGENDPDAPPADRHTPQITNEDRVFTRTTLEGF